MDNLGKITTREAEQAEEYIDARARMFRALDGIANAIGAKLLPAMIPLIDRTREWLAENRPAIVEGFMKAISDLSEIFSWTVGSSRRVDQHWRPVRELDAQNLRAGGQADRVADRPRRRTRLGEGIAAISPRHISRRQAARRGCFGLIGPLTALIALDMASANPVILAGDRPGRRRVADL